MNHHYSDIINRIEEKPLWWDENAVPRYCEFSPEEGAYIYASEIALVEIACQSCWTKFLVCFSTDIMKRVLGAPKYTPKLSTEEVKRMQEENLKYFIEKNLLHYGDPPNTGCCPAGATMNSIPLRVVEYYERSSETNHEWKRDKEYEKKLECDWMPKNVLEEIHSGS